MLRPSTKRIEPVTISAVYLVKNEEEWLPISVATVVNQVDEVIIIDTKSTDNTLALAKSMAQLNPKIRVVEFESDFDTLHEWRCRNRAIAMCSSEWIMMLDGDQILSDGWRVALDKHLRSSVCESVAVRYEHWVGSMEFIHKSFMAKQKGESNDPNIPLYQTCLFRKTDTLKAAAAAHTCPQFREAHHSRADESVPEKRRAYCDGATLLHAGFAKRNSVYMGEYRVLRGDYGHEASDKDWRIAEIRQHHNGFRFVGSVCRVDYGAERIPEIIRHMWGKTYNLELDTDGFIQRRTFVSNGEVTP